MTEEKYRERRIPGLIACPVAVGMK